MKPILLLLITLSLALQAKGQSDSATYMKIENEGFSELTSDLSRMEQAFQMLEDSDKKNCLVMLQAWINKQNESLSDDRIVVLTQTFYAFKSLYDELRNRFFEVCDKDDLTEARSIAMRMGDLAEQINELSLQIQANGTH